TSRAARHARPDDRRRLRRVSADLCSCAALRWNGGHTCADGASPPPSALALPVAPPTPPALLPGPPSTTTPPPRPGPRGGLAVAPGVKPIPSSRTSSSTTSSIYDTVTPALDALACLATFVSASWATRNSVTSSSASSCVGRPVVSTCIATDELLDHRLAMSPM